MDIRGNLGYVRPQLDFGATLLPTSTVCKHPAEASQIAMPVRKSLLAHHAAITLKHSAPIHAQFTSKFAIEFFFNPKPAVRYRLVATCSWPRLCCCLM